MRQKAIITPRLNVSTIFFIGLVVLIFTSVIVAIGSSANAGELIAIEQEIENTKSQNRQLQSKIVTETSLSSIEKKAAEIGLSESENTVTLVNQTSVAALR